MLIEDIIVKRVSIPFKEPIMFSTAARRGTNRIIVQVKTDEGITGLGETFYRAFTKTVLEENIKPLIIGKSPFEIEKINRTVEGAGFYHHQRAMVGALCTVNMAMLDIIGKKTGQPLYNLLGGKYRDPIAMIAYLFIEEPDIVAKKAKAFVDDGFKTIKLKVGINEQQDIEIVSKVREAVGNSIALRIDPNQAWAIGTAKRLIKKMEKYDPQYIEQPIRLDNLIGMNELRKSINVPIAACESCFTIYDAMNIIRHNAADVLNVDPHRAGGIWQAKKICSLAEAAGLPTNLHSGGELGISTAANLHIACSSPSMFYAIDSHYHHQTDDIIMKSFEYEGGKMRVPEGPGLGVELDYDKLEKYSSKPAFERYEAVREIGIADKPKY